MKGIKDAKPQPPPLESHPGRNATERLLKIHQLLSAQKFPNTPRLAREFEVTQKTIKRDLQWMKDHWNAPIEYARERGGYFYSRPVTNFPGVPSVTEAEMFALLVAHKALEQYQATPFHKPLQMAFQKLTGQLDSHTRYSLQDYESILSFRPFAPEVMDLERFESVTRALQHRRALRFEYKKPGAAQSEIRCVHPYHLTCNENLWYLIGDDQARGALRTFVLGRICGPVFVGEKFQPREFDLSKYLRGSFTILKGEGDYRVVLEFDAWATDMVRTRHWHTSQEIVPLPGGGCHLRLRLSALEEVERWVLSWGTHATVLEPKLLAERVAKIAKDLVGRYAERLKAEG